MAAGEIILSDGTTLKAEDIQKISELVRSQLAAESKDLTQYEEVDTLSGVSSLPGLLESGATRKLVRVAVSALKGVDGKTPEITADTTAIKWRYTGETEWKTLLQLSLLKGDKGDAGKKVELRKGETGIEWRYEGDAQYSMLVPVADLSFTYEELTEDQKQEISKKPVLSDVEATAGDTASGSFVADGTNEQGNPRWKLVVTLPKGETGKTPVLQQGTIATLEPAEDATFELTKSGTDGSGNPIYKLNLGIPKGNPGDGNVNVTNGESLEKGKKYAFIPDVEGGVTGTFSEIPDSSDDTYWLNGDKLEGLVSGATHEEILEALGGDITEAANAVTAGKKIFIRYSLSSVPGMVIPVSASAVSAYTIHLVYIHPNNIIYNINCSTSNTSDSYVRILYPDGYRLDSSFTQLTQESDSQAISDAVGGESGMKEIIRAVNDGNRLVVRGTTGKNIDLLCFSALEKENGDMNISVSAIGYGLFGGVVSYVIIEYIKSNDLFTITVVNLY